MDGAPLKEWSNVKIDGLKIGAYSVSLLDTEAVIMISQECIISLTPAPALENHKFKAC